MKFIQRLKKAYLLKCFPILWHITFYLSFNFCSFHYFRPIFYGHSGPFIQTKKLKIANAIFTEFTSHQSQLSCQQCQYVFRGPAPLSLSSHRRCVWFTALFQMLAHSAEFTQRATLTWVISHSRWDAICFFPGLFV